MSDERSISEILDQVSKNHRATLEKLSSDSDGKDDFTEGVSYFDQLQKIDLPKETIENYEKIFQSHRSFWERVQLFLKAENQAGRWAKVIKDFSLIFVPYGRQISTVTEFINQRLIPDAMAQSEKKTQKLLITNVIIGVASAAILLGVLPGDTLALSPDAAWVGVAYSIINGAINYFDSEPTK